MWNFGYWDRGLIKDAARPKSRGHEFWLYVPLGENESVPTVYDMPISLHRTAAVLCSLLKEQYRHVIYRWKAQNLSFTLSRGTRTCIRFYGSGVLGLMEMES